MAVAYPFAWQCEKPDSVDEQDTVLTLFACNKDVPTEDEGQPYMIMSWSTKEKFAVLKSIAFLVGADKRIAPQEMAVISGFLNRYGLDISAMNEQARMSQDEMEDIISRFSPSDKELVKSYWEETITCDGDVAVREVEVMAMMAENCGIDL